MTSDPTDPTVPRSSFAVPSTPIRPSSQPPSAPPSFGSLSSRTPARAAPSLLDARPDPSAFRSASRISGPSPFPVLSGSAGGVSLGSAMSTKRRESTPRIPETPNKRTRGVHRSRGSPQVHMLSPLRTPVELKMEKIVVPLGGGKSYFEESFVKLAEVGRGSSADVYKVSSKIDGGIYAVKVLTRESMTKRYEKGCCFFVSNAFY